MLAMTQRCRLDAISEQDEELLVKLHTDNDVRRYLGGVTDAKTALRQLGHMMHNPQRLGMSIIERMSGERIGIIDFGPHHDGAEIEISYMVLPRFWGTGLAAEAIAKALDYKFNTESALSRIVAETQTANTASCHLLERLGFTELRRLKRFGSDQTLFSKHRK